MLYEFTPTPHALRIRRLFWAQPSVPSGGSRDVLCLHGVFFEPLP